MNKEKHIHSPSGKIYPEEYADHLLEHISSDMETKDIQETKDELRNILYGRINKQKRQRKIRLAISVAASLLILLSLGYFGINKTDDKSIVWTELYVPNGERDSILLADGSKIYLNGGSTIKYPQTFKGKTRQVFFHGEGYFDIASNKKHPFHISTGQIDVEVLGTTFNVKAYPEDLAVEITLETGAVRLLESVSRQLVEMTPGECTRYDKNTNTFSTGTIDTDMISLWRTGKYSFQTTPFPELLQTLERGFGVTFICKNEEAMKERKFTGHFIKGESLDEILNIIKIGGKINYTKENGTIIIE